MQHTNQALQPRGGHAINQQQDKGGIPLHPHQHAQDLRNAAAATPDTAAGAPFELPLLTGATAHQEAMLAQAQISQLKAEKETQRETMQRQIDTLRKERGAPLLLAPAESDGGREGGAAAAGDGGGTSAVATIPSRLSHPKPTALAKVNPNSNSTNVGLGDSAEQAVALAKTTGRVGDLTAGGFLLAGLCTVLALPLSLSLSHPP
jgi:hypothetical protein